MKIDRKLVGSRGSEEVGEGQRSVKEVTLYITKYTLYTCMKS